MDGEPQRLDWPRTLVARGAARLQAGHLRHAGAAACGPALHCFVVDVSGSMLQHGQLAEAKGLLLAMMQAAGRRRDDVALLCFAANRVELRMPPGPARTWQPAWVAPIAGGGGTSLAQGMAEADALLALAARRAPRQHRCLWLFTDGRSPEQPPRPRAAAELHVVDFERGRIRLGRNAQLAARWAADCIDPDDLALPW